MFKNLLWRSGAHNQEITPSAANSLAAELSNAATTPSVQPNPMKRKRDSGSGDTAWPVEQSLGTSCIQNTEPFVSPSAPNEQVRRPQPNCATPNEPPSVTSPVTATGNSWRKIPGGGSSHHDSHYLSEKPNPTPRLLTETIETDPPPEPISLEILREKIESEFSMEILLKHRELRLIDQEIAKCQIALQQLWRCHVVPYPVMMSNLEEMQAVASGSGPPLGNSVPHPPPWGIMEGPYSRHYARWLMPDPAFDASRVESSSNQVQAGEAGWDRTTRSSVSNRTHVNMRSHRGSANARLPVLPHGYPEPKEEKSPLVLKRAADGCMVKLVCTDCHRDNFNSAQGFINHCRIAHNRGYATHEAAALACGVEVENDPGPTSIVGSPTATGVTAGLIHPLIRYPTKAATTPRHLSLLSSRRKKSTAPAGDTGGLGRSPTVAAKTPSTSRGGRFSQPIIHSAASSFVPSPQTPHLSALFAKRGHGGNLKEMVDQAKTRVDSNAHDGDSSEDEDQDEEMEDMSQALSGPRSLSTRGVAGRAGLSRRPGPRPPALERTPSNKSIPGSRRCQTSSNTLPSSMTYDSPYAVNPTHAPPPPAPPTLDASPSLNLSPNAIIESHQAPSLISDDDGDEYENMHSESDSPKSAEDDDDDDGHGGRFLEFEIEAHDDDGIDELGGGSDSRNLGMAATAAKPHAPSAGAGARRSSALRSPTTIRSDHPSTRDEQRHVSFASPSHPGMILPKSKSKSKSQERKDSK